jgi:hypothetical protein
MLLREFPAKKLEVFRSRPFGRVIAVVGLQQFETILKKGARVGAGSCRSLQVLKSLLVP